MFTYNILMPPTYLKYKLYVSDGQDMRKMLLLLFLKSNQFPLLLIGSLYTLIGLMEEPLKLGHVSFRDR